MNRTSASLKWAIVVIALAACSPVTDESTTSIDAGSSSSSTASDPTSSTESPEPKSACLAEPKAQGDRGEAGAVTERFSGYAEVDCVEVFGGEPIQEQAVLATDDEGVIDFGLELADADCRLAPTGRISILPSDEIAFDITNGVLLCAFHGGSVIELEATTGETVATADIGEETIVMYSSTGGTTTIIVIRGFVTVDPFDAACRSVVGPGQEAEISSGGSFSIRRVDVPALPDLWSSTFGLDEASLNPAASAELLPGLSEMIDDKEVTVLVDGDLIGESSATEDFLPALELITGSRLDLGDQGQITVIQPSEAAQPSPVESPPESRIAPFLQPFVEIDPDLLTEALESTTTVEPAVMEFFLDPEGHQWSIAFDASDPTLEEELRGIIQVQLESGAYGAFHREVFDDEPNYDVMLPGLIGDSESCRDR